MPDASDPMPDAGRSLMRAARLLPSLAVVTLAVSLLAGCGGSSSGNGSSATGSSAASASSAGGGSGSGSGSGSSAGSSGSAGSSSDSGSGSKAGLGSGGSDSVSCAVAPAALVGAALGDTLSATQETRNGDTIVVCDYKGAKAGVVKLRIQTDSSATAFAADKKGFATQSMKTTDETFADEAFSNVRGSGPYQVTTLVARKGPVEILVVARATVAQEKGLLSQLFNRL
jgi:hypothetical protein